MEIDFKEILEEIQKEQLKTIVSVPEFKGSNGTSILATKRRGLYWLWTTSSNAELEQIIFDESKIRHVPIANLVKQRKYLQNICDITSNGFRIVYNGIGGYRTDKKGFGLRERILQEINCNDPRTGTLNIMANCKDMNKWAVSFFDFDDVKNAEILEELKSNNVYTDYATIFENLWRLEYGTPILSRH